MRPLTLMELLEIWEHGIHQSAIVRSLYLLSVSCSIPDLSDVARLSIGDRDAHLLQLREWMFGSILNNVTDCPNCHEKLEWQTGVQDLRLQTVDTDAPVRIFELQQDGYNIRFRLPNSEDLIKATTNPDYRSNPEKLLGDCILSIQSNSKVCGIDELPDSIIGLINHRMAEEDPQADLRMVLSCPQCAHGWEAPFNILTYLWSEIDTWARHILEEVYILARTFSWSERDILNMSSHRRQLYLEMIRS